MSPGTSGSTGDVRPLIALALALRGRGFGILFVADQSFERAARQAGIQASEWFSSTLVPQGFWLRTAAGQRGLWGDRRRRRDRWVTQELRNHWSERAARFWRTIDGPNNSRIVAVVGAIPACRLLRRFGPSCAKIVSCPMPYQPSAHFTLTPPDLSLVTRALTWMRAGRTDPEEQRAFCEDLFHLVSASPSVFPRPTDWLPNMQVTGYTPLEDDGTAWSPPAELTDFLAEGPPPIYVGFGNHAVLFGARGRRRIQAIVDGCQRLNIRCILQSPDVPPSFASSRLFVLNDDVSHAWLFPRCSAIVHHGGYGTLHAALVARRPMVIYPFQTDQFLWAARMGELGVGPGFTERLRFLSAERLETDLTAVLDGLHQEAAERLGSAVVADQGLTVQVAAIEAIVEHTQRGLRPLNWRMPAGPASRLAS